ncbi:MAG: hypothetical protein J0M19_08350 [Sphingomonadales bacterium]|nr:hypothetical protein [Sphingomonadales bacterium]
MQMLRAFLLRYRWVAALVIAAALCIKALVPAGYMIGTGTRVLTIEICADAQGGHVTQQIVLPGDGQPIDGQGKQGKADGACAFSALSFVSLGGADAALLALALLFILALGLVPMATPRPARLVYLRPPLRGPPALI